MKEVINVSGFDDVIIYSEFEPQVLRDEHSKIVSKHGDIIPHKKVAKKVSFYFPKYNSEGYRIGVDLLTLDVSNLANLLDRLESIKMEPTIDSEYYNDDLPF